MPVLATRRCPRARREAPRRRAHPVATDREAHHAADEAGGREAHLEHRAAPQTEPAQRRRERRVGPVRLKAPARAAAAAAAHLSPSRAATLACLTNRRYARRRRRASLQRVLLGVDVGGTFTDAVLALEDGRLVTAKAPSTPADQSRGVMAAVRSALERADRGARDVEA